MVKEWVLFMVCTKKKNNERKCSTPPALTQSDEDPNERPVETPVKMLRKMPCYAVCTMLTLTQYVQDSPNIYDPTGRKWKGRRVIIKNE